MYIYIYINTVLRARFSFYRSITISTVSRGLCLIGFAFRVAVFKMEVSQTSIQCIDTYISYISRFFSTIPFFSPTFFVFEEEREPFLLESRFLRQVLRIWQ